jgi:4-hydroxy-3-polyprenylbenzoate decarboxylase
MTERKPPRLVVGVTGASGAIYGVRVLDACRDLGVESHLIVSRAAALTLAQETDLTVADLAAKADITHKVGDVGASVASGSFRTMGMIIAPCSVRTMSEIATGVTSSLLTRAADVALKERRPLVRMVRETPPWWRWPKWAPRSPRLYRLSMPGRKVWRTWSTSRSAGPWTC